MNMAELELVIDEKIGEVRTEALDISFGEIASLHQSRELIIDPEYQRLFRWSPEQQSRLIESILLELPVPPFFVVENQNGVYELIDGLQRVSSMIRFLQPEMLGLEPLMLVGCELIGDLNGLSYNDLPLSLRLRLKRSAIRVVVIKRQSSPFLRYEMFKRLNTGGSLLAPQEIRNCTARMVGDPGIMFYKFLQDLAKNLYFRECTETLSQADRDQKADEELVLRFFALKNAQDLFRGSVRDWLDDYMDQVVLGRVRFGYDEEHTQFDRVFEVLANVLGSGAFVRYRGNDPIGALAPAYFEAVTMGFFRTLEIVPELSKDAVQHALVRTVQSDQFRDVTGPGANSKQKLEGRISLVQNAILSLASA
jgi:hypothetical protein